MKVVIIKYNAGNIRSVYFALNRLGLEAEITDDPDAIQNADKVIFPGVGEASSTMSYLRDNGLANLIPTLHQPVLAICLGMQLFCSSSEEGDAEGLGILNERVKRFRGNIKVPHMGWNRIHDLKGPLFHNIREGSFVYFVHSYYVPDSLYTAASTEYGIRFSAAAQYRNFYATQFHPEKSGEVGAQILKNFISL
jgi:glutamine amidotransferase